jgi:predicted DNA-binding ribbon-helix-helix protein
MPSSLINKNVTVDGIRSSMRLESALWDALENICLRESLTLGELVDLAADGSQAGGRTSAVRRFVLEYYRTAASEVGHSAAGHGRYNSPQPQTVGNASGGAPR